VALWTMEARNHLFKNVKTLSSPKVIIVRTKQTHENVETNE
jgi:hypothetical protein